MIHNFRQLLLTLLSVTFFTIIMIQCDSIIPNAFQEEDFIISSLGERACQSLNCALISADSLNPCWLKIASSRISDVVDTSQWSGSTIEQIIGENFETLQDSTDVVTEEETFLVHYPEGESVSYVSYPSPKKGQVYFFVSWNYTEDNHKGIVDIDLIQQDGTLLEKKPETIPLETVAGCLATQTMNTGEEIKVPRIKGQNEFETDNESYLIKFSITEPSETASIDSFFVVILR